MNELYTFGLIVFTSFFTLINPLGTMPIFMSMTSTLSDKRRKQTAKKAVVVALLAILAFAFAMLEVSDSLILAQQAEHYPITKAIYALLSMLGNGQEVAAALGVWAMAFLGVAIAGAFVLVGRKGGGIFRL